MTFSVTVMASTSMKCWWIMLMPAAMASRGVWSASTRSLKTIVPASAGTIPKRMFIRVVLPLPFSPSRPMIRPAGTSKSIPRLARTSPYAFVIPRIVSMATVRSPETSGAAARVVLGRRHLQGARRELLLQCVDLGDDRGGHGRIEAVALGVEQIGAARARSVIAVRDVRRGELARAQVVHGGDIHVGPLLVDVREHAFGRDGRVAERSADRVDILLLRGLDDAGVPGVELARYHVRVARDQREGRLFCGSRVLHALEIDDAHLGVRPHALHAEAKAADARDHVRQPFQARHGRDFAGLGHCPPEDADA